MNWLSTSKSVSRPTRALAILAICASLLVAATGLSLTNVPSGGTTTRPLHDPENPAYVFNTIGSSTTSSQTSQILRDPENPYWTGATIGSPATTGSRTIHDPENPYWTGATIDSTTAGGSSTPNLK